MKRAKTQEQAGQDGNANPESVVEVNTRMDNIVFPDIPDAPKGRQNGGLSIRQVIMKGLSDGKSTASIAHVVKELFPGTMAAEKSSKHIAYYRSLMKKAGQLPTTTATEAQDDA